MSAEKAKDGDSRFAFDRTWSADVRVVLLLLVAVAILYGPSINDEFHFDDGLILEDSNVTNPERWSHFLNPLRLRQVTFFSFWVNHTLGGADPAGYHAVNIALHAVNGLLLYLLLGPLVGGWVAAAAALAFVCHPVVSEPVLYVYQRSTLLATSFGLAGLHATSRLARSTSGSARRSGVGVAVACFVLAAWSKETALAVPLVILPVARPRPRTTLLIVTGVVVAGMLALVLLSWLGEETVGLGVMGDVSPASYLITEFRVLATYARLVVFPYPQSLEYDFPRQVSFLAPAVIAGFLGVLLTVALAMRLIGRQRWEWAGYGLLAGLLLLAPTSSVIPSQDFAFEHRLYLPMLGLALAFAVTLSRFRYRSVVLASVLLVWCGLTVARGRTWSTDVRLWEATVQQVGSKARAWFNLGGAYLAAGDPRARDAFLRVLDLEPGRPEVFYNLGLIDQREGSLVTALSWYEQALGMDADYWPALVNSGNVRHALGDPVGAIAAYLDTLAVNPDYWPAQYNLAVVYADTDRPDLAEARLRTVLDWEPEFRDARALLAVSLSQLGRDAEAEREWTVLGIEPVDPGRTADVPAPLGAED